MNRQEAMKCFKEFPIYGITAEAMSNGRDNMTVVKAMLEAGIKFIQYREKEKTGLARYEECLKLKKLTAEYGAAFIIDDFVDLAIAVDADGVHIGQDDLPVPAVRKLLGPDKIIGLSTHSPEQLEKANEIADLIDYIGCGPVYATNTKKTAVPVGLEYVKYATEHAKMPFVAIGGIKEHNIHEVYNAGATTIAVVSDITSADDIVDKISKLAKK
ncbi:MAG: thiamine phosphate synthase [Selenomonadales bacterium]|nr:thiamine phosphate synthase [Selenomonadales bacterium]MEE1362815.1 thiamine phosphate synthase [Selenomonadaceae bacterium]